MSNGKAKFLRNLRDAVVQRKKADAAKRVAFDYLKRWSAGLGESPNGNDIEGLKYFVDLAGRREETERSKIDSRLGKLFEDCELNSADPVDRNLLLEALAETVYPRQAGAGQKWDAAKANELWKDIVQIQEEYAGTPEAQYSGKKLSSQAIAEALLKSRSLGPKYCVQRQGSAQSTLAGSLRKRVDAALDARLDFNPNSLIYDFDYVLRGDPKKGPACAAGLTFEPALSRGSKAAAEAASLEKELFADVSAFFDALGLFMTDSSKLACRRAARKIARRSVRQKPKEQ